MSAILIQSCADPGYYFTGDGVGVDRDGYHWIKGRVDDVINVSGMFKQQLDVHTFDLDLL